jgi:acyl-CoA thioesterase I
MRTGASGDKRSESSMPISDGTQVNRRILAKSGAVGAVLGVAGLSMTGTRALTQTPAASPAAPSEDELVMVANQLRYVHPEKVYDYLPGFQDEAVIAAIFGVDVETYRAARELYAEAARSAADELLADATFAAQVDALPFQPGATVVGIGESDSDDLQSGLEIIRHVLDLRRPDDGIEVLNLAISGQATSEAVGRLPGIVQQREPDWVICGLGGNDTLRNGADATKPRVSITETELNLAEMRQIATTQGAEWVFLTRWQIDPERIAAFPPFQEQQIRIDPADWDAVNEAIRQQEGLVIDLEPVFGSPLVADYLEFDGLHPTLAGQREIARTVVAGLGAWVGRL